MLTGIVVDAVDVVRLEQFWLAATRGRTGGLALRFAPTTTPKTDKNRLHLDLASGPDQRAEVERLLALGATRIDIGQGDVAWDVLADPEGNEFCVVPEHDLGAPTPGGVVGICLDTADEHRAAQTTFLRGLTGWDHLEEFGWGVRLRRDAATAVALVMGPPVARKTARNRWRLEVTAADRAPGERTDPAGNEFELRAPVQTG